MNWSLFQLPLLILTWTFAISWMLVTAVIVVGSIVRLLKD